MAVRPFAGTASRRIEPPHTRRIEWPWHAAAMARFDTSGTHCVPGAESELVATTTASSGCRRARTGDMRRAYRDTGRAHSDVIDVAAALRHAPVMQKHHAVLGRPALELACKLHLALRASSPSLLMLRLAADGRHDPAQGTEAPTDAGLAIRAVSLVLTTCARTSCRELGWRRRSRLTRDAARLPTGRVPDRELPCGQRSCAYGARVGPAELHTTGGRRHPADIDAGY